MQQTIEAFLILLPFFIIAKSGSWLAGFCARQGLVDTANHRSSHTTPTPRGGGLAIVLMSLLGMAGVLAYFDMPTLNTPFIVALLAGSCAVALMGWLDDVRHRPALVRLLVQAAAVAGALYFMPQLFQFMPLYAEKILLGLAWVWFINLYNFMDGLDGYAATEAVFICLGLMLILPEIKWLFLPLMGACLGFLRINWNPAKLFMGDVGSTFLGFIFGGLLIYGVSFNSPNYVWPLFTLPLLFSADATYTLITRLCKGQKPWQAHRDHWYQRAARLGLSHSQVTLRAVGLNIILLVLTIASVYANLGPISVVLGLALLGGVAYWLKHQEG